MSYAKMKTYVATVSAVALLLTGCAVGPDFARPPAPDVKGFTSTPLMTTPATDVNGGAAQSFLVGANITAQWWTLFQSPALNALIEQSLKNNPTLQAAQASLRQAQENQAAIFGVLIPSVDGHFNTTRQKSYGAFGGGGAVSVPPYTVNTASVSVSYALDLFGQARRAYESQQAQTDYARFQMEAAYLTLTSNVVLTAVQQASLRAQVDATQAILGAQEQQLGVLRRQLELGGVAEADVLTQLTAVAQTRAQLPTLQKQLSQTNNQLLALAGRFPDETLVENFDLITLSLPQELPVSLPSQIVAQRPDIRASEAQLHSASAQIGVATADMLPQITLNGSYGSSASDIGNLFSAGAGIWSVAAGVTQPIFHGGELLHKKRAAVAAFDTAAAQYRGTVLGAFQNVSDVLNALQTDAVAVKALLEAERAAATSLSIAQNQYQTGATNFLTLLDAQRTYQQARVALVQAQAARYADTSALLVALGGGWWNRPENVADNSAPANSAKEN